MGPRKQAPADPARGTAGRRLDTGRRRRSATPGRDAARSRRAILDAAERSFAEHGFRGSTLEAIAAEAGLARATPSYFFGSKEELYREVLRSVYGARELALDEAFAPLRAWAGTPAPSGQGGAQLEEAMMAAVAGYFAFFDARPSFARLVEWEALDGAERLGGIGGQTMAVSNALRAVHAVRGERGLRDFDPALVSIALVSMCFLPLAHAATFRRTGAVETSGKRFREAYKAEVARAVLHLLGAG
jgi:TetR/AcrR family transcriptional regulator